MGELCEYQKIYSGFIVRRNYENGQWILLLLFGSEKTIFPVTARPKTLSKRRRDEEVVIDDEINYVSSTSFRPVDIDDDINQQLWALKKRCR